MIRRFLILGMMCCLFFSGCAPKNTRPLLWYQDIFTEIILCEGNARWHIAPIPGGYTAEILSPASAAGVVFTVTDTASSVRIGAVQIPVSEAMLGECRLILSLFSLQEEFLVGIDSPGDDPDGITCARFRTDEAEYTVGFRTDGTPAYFEIITGSAATRYLTEEIRWEGK